MIEPQVIPDPVFDSLVGGEGGREAVLLLRRSRRSRSLLLLKQVLDGPCGPAASAAADVLADVERAAPAAVASVLDGPSFGSWARHATRACPAHRHDGRCATQGLAAFAAVAAVRADTAVTVSVPSYDGLLHLPGLGTAMTSGSSPQALVVTGDGPAVQIRSAGHVLRLPRDHSRAGRDWQPVAWLRAEHRGLALALPLETADRLLPALDTVQARPAAWQGLLRSAWELLVERHPRRAEELASGLTAIVPLPAPARGVTSSTSRHAFGAVLTSWPAEPQRMALTLLHEFQHSKLSALTDLVTLYEPGGRPWLFAPWRPDPRPPGGLLQGIYAHLGDLAFWHDLGGVVRDAEQADAAWRFAQVRAHVERGLAEAAAHVRLTALGERFLARAGKTVRALDSRARGSVDERLLRAVARVEAGSEAVWRLRWAMTEATPGVRRLAALWLAALPAGRLPADEIGSAPSAPDGPGPELARWAARQRGADRAVPVAAAAQAAAARPDHVERWAELAAAAEAEQVAGAFVLGRRTELVKALFLELAGGDPALAGPGGAADPLALAAWLEQTEPRPEDGTVQNIGVSMSQNARSPLRNTRATG